MSATAHAATYYVSKDDGDDNYDGLAPTHEYGSHGPWRSIWRTVYAGDWGAYYYPGSTILFKRGNVWDEGYEFTVYGYGTSNNPNRVGSYGDSWMPNPKIVGTSNQQNGSTGVSLAQPDYWSIEDIDFHNEYRAIHVALTTTGHSNFTVRRCNFSNGDAWVLRTETSAWPQPAATGILIDGSGGGVSSGADILTHVTIDSCQFTKMGQAIGIGNIGHDGNEGLVTDTTISNCVMQDGSFTQLAGVGAHDFKVLKTKIWNNGVNIWNGPAGFSFYGAIWKSAPTNLTVEDCEIGFSHVCDSTGCSPSDGEGIELGAVNGVTLFNRVLFHHNDATAFLANGQVAGVQFQDCVFAADEAYDVNGPGCEQYGEFRLHAHLYASVSGCRFLPRDGLPDIPELSGQGFCGGGWHSAPAAAEITYSNTTTSEYGKEALGSNLASGASWSYQYTDESGYATWLYTFTDQTTVNTVKLTESPGAGISKFVVQYWDGTRYRDAYTGKGVGTSKYDNYLPFPAITTTFLRVQRLEPNAPLGLSAFEVYNANGTNPTDQFMSTTLNENWYWPRPYGSWNLYNHLGFLRIATDGQDLWGAGGHPNSIVLRSVPGGDWTATTRLQFSPSTDYQQAGIILYGDDDNYVKLVFGHDTAMGGTAVEFTNESGASPWQLPKVGVNTPAIFLRLVKSGSTYLGYYSLDNASWAYVGQFPSGPNSARIGLIAQGVTGAYPDFDWFDLR